MSTEASRHQLYDVLKVVLSVEPADELLSYLPPVGWADVATKADLGMIRNEMDAQRAETRGDLAEMRGELGGQIAALDVKFGGLDVKFGGLDVKFGGLDLKLDGLSEKLDAKFESADHKMVGAIATTKTSMMVWTMTTVTALVFGIMGAAFALAKLIH